MKLVTAILAKNEAAPERYLTRVLERCASFSDDVLLLDDGSIDDTVAIAKRAGALVKQRSQTGAWGNEAPARQELWERGAKLAGDGWLLICDADMLLQGDPRPLCASWDVAAWSFVLYDCWDDEQHARVDRWWATGPQLPRPWLFKPSAASGANLTFGPADAVGRKNWTPQFNDRGIHVGHMPGNWQGACFPAPFPQYYWTHLAYAKREHRKEKYERYMGVRDQLSPFEYEHASSILD